MSSGKQQAEIVVSGFQVGFKADSLMSRFDGLLAQIQFGVRYAQTVVGIRKVGIQTDCATIELNRSLVVQGAM